MCSAVLGYVTKYGTSGVVCIYIYATELCKIVEYVLDPPKVAWLNLTRLNQSKPFKISFVI